MSLIRVLLNKLAAYEPLSVLYFNFCDGGRGLIHRAIKEKLRQ